MTTAIYPGTFDPPTLGHMDVIQRLSRIFDRVVVSVVMNVDKSPMLETDERVELMRACTERYPNVSVDSSMELLVEFASRYENPVIVKGLRNHIDYEYETTMAVFNKQLDPSIETFFITSDQKYTYVSSTAVRQLAMYGSDLSAYVPENVARAIYEKTQNWR
jgi:pantetheine-phosphate adenylyltransferase